MVAIVLGLKVPQEAKPGTKASYSYYWAWDAQQEVPGMPRKVADALGFVSF